VGVPGRKKQLGGGWGPEDILRGKPEISHFPYFLSCC